MYSLHTGKGEYNMGQSFSELIGTISNFVWGPPLLILLVGTGIYLTVRLGGNSNHEVALRIEARIL